MDRNVYLSATTTTGTLIEGNYIGTNAAGTAGIGYTATYGIRDQGAGNNTVGGITNTFGTGPGNVISGNSIGISVIDTGPIGVSTIEGNEIGTNAAGTAAIANTDGVAVGEPTVGQQVGGTAAGAGNLISGNTSYGVVFDIATSGSVVEGNWIGTDITGTHALANGYGVAINNGASSITVGGTTAGAGNVISGNTIDGVYISDVGTSNNVVQGNYIGTTAAGTAALGNGSYGVLVQSGATSTTIGGFTPTPGTGAGNVISSNQTGIGIQGSNSSGKPNGVTIRGNLIGTNASGTAALGNAAAGVLIDGSPTNVTIGGDDAADGTVDGVVQARNVISGTTGTSSPYTMNGGPGEGIYANQVGAGFLIEGNYVGTGITGTSALPNLYGIAMGFGLTTTTVGGTTAGAGNLLSGNSQYGLTLGGGSIVGQLNHYLVQGNRIGTNATGTAALANGSAGILLSTGATGNTIGGTSAAAGNLISGNTSSGIHDSNSPGNLFEGNFIGTNAAGTAALGNGFYGILIDNSGTNASSNTISGNVIAGNRDDGIQLNSTAADTLIQGNFIGTNAAGTAALANTQYGIEVIGVAGTTVGGTTTSARNVISGNTLGSVNVTGSGASGTLIEGDYLGTNAAGTAALGNSTYGIVVQMGAVSTTIGGFTPTPGTGAGNVISGNQIGIGILNTTDHITIQGNLIGTNASGTAALGNAAAGILINDDNNSTSIVIGGDDAADGTVDGVVEARNVISGTTGLSSPFAMNGGPGEGIYTNQAGAGLVIQGNYVGTDITGTTALPNANNGIATGFGASTVTIGGTTAGEGNLLSGNKNSGLSLGGGSSVGLPNHFLIEGNRLGTNAAGTAALANTTFGMSLSGGVTGNTIGGTVAGAGNLFSGNGSAGILDSNAPGNLFEGNLIGTNAAGTAAVANGFNGIYIDNSGTNASNNTISGNVIGGNVGDGIQLNSTAADTVIQGNSIGTNASSSAALANTGYGVDVIGAAGTTIGGTTATARNVISGNTLGGVNLTNSGATGNVVEGNLIGTDATGNIALANGGNGVNITAGASGNTIGGLAPGAASVVTSGGVLGNVYGVAVTANGDLILPDAYYSQVVRVNAQTGAQTVLASGGHLNTPDGVALAADGTIYVADSGFHGTGAIIRIDPTTGAQTVVTSGGLLVSPDDLAVAADGSLYVSDSGAYGGHGAIFHINPTTGTLVLVTEGNGPLKPVGFAIASDGSLLVAYTDLSGTNAEVDRVNPTTGVHSVLSSQGLLVNPLGLTIAPDGSLLVANISMYPHPTPTNPGAGNIVRIDPTTGAQTLAYTGGLLGYPYEMAFAPDGDLYVTNYTTDPSFAPQVLRFAANGARNVISGNTGDGVHLSGTGTTANLIEGNFVGTTATGTAALGNVDNGVNVTNGASGNTIGSTTANADNVIAFNDLAGVGVTGASIDDAVRGNSTYANGTLGIDLGDNGVTLNDSAGHSGPNNYQDFPVLTAGLPGTATRVVGSLTGTPHTTYAIDVFANSAADPSGYGQGRRYLGSGTVTTDASGSALIDLTVPGASSPTDFLSATATDPAGNTSEFAADVADNINTSVSVGGAPTSSIPEGTPVTLVAVTVAPDVGQTFSYQWAVTKNGAAFDLGTESSTEPTLVFTPDQAGSYVASLVVTDNYGNRAAAVSSTISVTTVNPVVSITGAPTTATTGFPVPLQANVTDIGTANQFTYAWSVNGVLVPSATGPDFAYSPTTGGLAAVNLTVTANDGGVGTASTAFPVTGGQPVATIAGAPPASPEGVPISLSNVVFDPSLSGQLTYTWVATRNATPFASATGPVFSFTPNLGGTYQVALAITDASGHTGVASPVTINIVSVQPTAVIANPPRTASAGAPLTFNGSASIPGAIDAETVSWSVLSATGQIVPSGTGPTFSFTPSAAGQYVVSLTATSAAGLTGSTSAVVTVPVIPADVRLTLPTTAFQGVAVLPSAIVNNGTASSYTYTWTVTGQSAPFQVSGTTTGSGTNTFSFVPRFAGTYTVSVAVVGSDGSSGTASGTITAAPVVPQVSITGAPTAGTTVYENTALTLGATVSDVAQPSGVPYGYQWTVLAPDGSVLAAGLGSTLGVTPPRAGTYTASVTVTDADGASATTTMPFVITEPPPKPIIEGGPVTVNQNNTVTYDFPAFVPGPSTEIPPANNFTWTVTQNGQQVAPPASGTNFAFTPTQPGNYVVTLAVTDTGGTGMVSAAVNLAPQNTTVTLTPAPAGTTEQLVFAQGNNTLDASQLPATSLNILVALGGHDTLIGGAGTNVLQGDSGNNLLIGGSGQNTFFGVANDTMVGGSGTNLFQAMPSVAGPLTVTAGTGPNTLSFAQAGVSGLVLNLTETSGQMQSLGGSGAQIALNGQFQNVYLGHGNNNVVAGSGMNLFGGDGNDTLSSTGGLDITLTGGTGTDSLSSVGGTSITLFGGSGTDSLSSTGGLDVSVIGGSGTDSLSSVGGTSITLFGGSGDDTLSSSGGLDVSLIGGSGTPSLPSTGNDSLTAVGGTSITLFGSGGDDTLTSTGGFDISLVAGSGPNTLMASGGNDIILLGGGGNDSLSSSDSTSITLFGGGGNDTISSTGGTDVTVVGGTGNDSISSGSDSMGGGNTSITLFGGSGNDTITTTGGLDISVLAGNGGTPTTPDQVSSMGGTSITLFGGSGDDTLASTGGNDVTIIGGTGTGVDSLASSGGTSISLFGTGGNDTLSSTGGLDITMVGGQGLDSLYTSGGTSITLFGGSGNDTIASTGGTDVTVVGGTGNDSISSGTDSMGSGNTSITLFGGSGDDTLSTTGGLDVSVLGGSGGTPTQPDVLMASGGTSITLFGGSGDDTVSSTGGTEIPVIGGTGNDSLGHLVNGTGLRHRRQWWHEHHPVRRQRQRHDYQHRRHRHHHRRRHRQRFVVRRPQHPHRGQRQRHGFPPTGQRRHEHHALWRQRRRHHHHHRRSGH